MFELLNWEQLPALAKFFWIIAIASSVIFLVLLILSFLATDLDNVDIDAGHLDLDVSGVFLNSKSILAFLIMFGWAGVVAFSIFKSFTWIIVFAIFFGILGLLVAALILWGLYKLKEEGTLDLNNAIGKTGTVILRIPPKMQGKGQVQVVIQNSLRTLDAMTEENEIIPSGKEIQIIDIIGDNVLKVISKI